MKTITITINISEEIQQPLTIKSSIQEQITFHLKEKENAKKLKIQINKQIKNSLIPIALELNAKVGENLWTLRKEGLEIGFGTTSLRVEFSSERITFGNIEYYKPNIKSIEHQIVYLGGGGYRYISKPLQDLEELHNLAKKDYIKYFTNKL